jgi:hypothetical protein
MANINDQYLNRHQKLIAALNKQIRNMYESAIVSIAFVASTTPPKKTKFSLSIYPSIKKEIDKQLKKLHADIYSAIISGIEQSWDLSNEKNDLIVDRRLAGKRPSRRARQILYDPNKQALAAYLKRKERGMDLSKRIWKTLDPFKHEMEQGLGIMISEGQSASKMATRLKSYLNEPERLYRRVRGEDGKLHLSANARNYSPGQGVYRSSYKNALRLSRTENNDAYRTADFERWQTLPFVTGIEVRLSNYHPKFDICDSLVGKYPKDFKFRGWHTQCLCHAVPIMMSDAEYEKYEDKILGLGTLDERTIKRTVGIPTRASNYIQQNAERINGWKNTPYFVRDNPRYLKDLFK